MPAPQTSYTQYHRRWPGAGFESQMQGYSNITRLVETVAGIPFGRAVSQGTGDKQAILGGTKFLGVSVMDQLRDPSLIGNTVPFDYYEYRANMAVKTRGPIVVVNNSGGAVAPEDPVYWDAATGRFANIEGAVSVGAPAFSGTGNGVLTKAGTPYGANHVPGTYTIRVVAAAANAGRFVVIDPQGDEVGEGNVGTAFAGPVAFTIADGSTDFIVGDQFTLLLSVASQGPVPGATWKTTAADGALAEIHLGIQK
jgi:hypothetical protein